MKKILKGLLFAFVAVFGVSLASCTETPVKTPTPIEPAHTHSLVDGWKRDSAVHWHECSGCDELVDMDAHNFADWVLATDKCEKSRVCTVCEYKETKTVDHTWNAEGTCTVCGETLVITQYYVRGSFGGSDWPALDDYKLAIDYSTKTATITVSLKAGDEFKVADSKWSAEFNAKTIKCAEGLFDGDNNIIVKTTADYKIVLSKLETSTPECEITQLCVHEYTWTKVEGKTCEYTGVCSKCQATSTKVEHAGYGEWTLVEGKTCDFEQVCACGDKKTKVEHTWGDDIVCDKCQAVNVVQYYVRGDMNGWGATDALVLGADKKSSSILLVVEAGQGFKIASEDWSKEFNFDTITFNVNGFEKAADSNNIVASKAGVYVVNVAGLDTLTPTCTIDPVQLYVKGDMNGWGANADYALSYDKETDKATFTLELSDVSQGFKVAPNDWDLHNKQYNLGVVGEGYGCGGESANIKFTEAGFYVITVSGVSTGTPTLAIEKGEGTVEPVVTPVPDLYVKGAMNGWAAAEDYKLVVDSEADTATLEFVVVAGQEFKVANADWSYEFNSGTATLPEGLGGEGNIKATATGLYKVVVSGLADKATATCVITKVAGVSTIAEVKAAADDTVVLVSGSIKSVFLGGTSVITDGENDLDVYKLSTTSHLCVGDVVVLYGTKSSYKDNPQLAQGATIISHNKVKSANAVSLSAITSVDQLVDGMEIVIAYEKNLMGLSSSNGEYRTHMVSDSLSIVDDPCVQLVKLVKADTNWFLQVAEGQNLYATDAKKLWTGEKTDDSAKWTISIADGVTTITNVSFHERLIQFNTNAGQERFAAYKNTEKNPTLYSVEKLFDVDYCDYSGVLTEGTVFKFDGDGTDNGTKTYTIGGGWRLIVVVDAEGRIAYMVQNIDKGFGMPKEEHYSRHSNYADWSKNPAFANFGETPADKWGNVAYDVVVPQGGFAFSVWDVEPTLKYIFGTYTEDAVSKNSYNVDNVRLSLDPVTHALSVSKIVVEFNASDLTAAGDKEDLTQAELPTGLVLTGTVDERTNDNGVYAVELTKKQGGTISYTATVDCVITLTIGSSSGSNQSHFAAICDDEYVAGETASANLEKLENNIYIVTGTKYAENAISFKLEAGKTYTFAAIERANPDSDQTIKDINGRAVRVTSIVIAE